MTIHPRIAVITVGYKNKADLEEYFLSLHSSTYRNFDIIFLDNFSEDGSVEWIQRHYPDTILHALKHNYGFAEGNNLGIRAALKKEYEYIFLLNPDTVVDPNCLARLIKAADGKGVIQPLLLLHEHGVATDLVNSAGNTLNYLGFSYVNHYQELAETFTRQCEIALCSGAVALVPTSILREVGEFDGSFFTYHEDVDLFWRIRMQGYDITLLPEAKVWHKYIFSKSKRKFFFAERNRILFMLKTYELRTLLLIAPFSLMTELLMMAFSLKDGWFPQKLSAYYAVFALLPHICKERVKLQNMRILRDKDLIAWWSSSLKFGAVKIPGVNLFNSICNRYWDVVKKLM